MSGRPQQPGGNSWARHLILGSWADEAACAGHPADWWFPADHGRRRIRHGDDRQAKNICNTCAVITQCLQHALDHDESDGVWGGLSAEERRELLAAPPLPPMSEMAHGTEAGAKQHERRNEEPCPRCRDGARRAQIERRARRRQRRTLVD